MRIALPLFILAALLGGTAGLARGEEASSDVVDQDYVLALHTVNRFLCAWTMRSQEEGLQLLSPSLKRRFSEENLRMYIAGISNPHHTAFEVGRGRRLDTKHYAFGVTLYEHYTGQKWSRKKPGPLKLVVVQISPEEWLVDELPGLTTEP
jgi:disulfide oxidoreductase YuzD